MAIGIDEIKTTGRLIFDLERGEDKTTRSIDIPYPLTDTSSLQTLVNTNNARYTSASNALNIFIQPANWRDTNTTEEQWTTTGVRYEIVTTSTTPITPDSPDTLGAAQHEEHYEKNDQQNDQQN